MSARAIQKGLEKALIITVVVKNGTTVAEGLPLVWSAGQADLATAGQNAFGIAMSGVVGDGVKTVQVLMLSNQGVIARVLVGTGGVATQGEYAECGTAGFTNRTLGGGTTVRYICGKFHETGVPADYVGLELGSFAGVSA